MSISKMFGIPEDTVKKMVNRGVIPCSVSGLEDAYKVFKQELSTGVRKTQAITNTAEKLGICERTVYKAIAFFE